MLRKSVETRDWLNTVEPRTVRAVMKRVVEEITRYHLIIYWEFSNFADFMTPYMLSVSASTAKWVGFTRRALENHAHQVS